MASLDLADDHIDHSLRCGDQQGRHRAARLRQVFGVAALDRPRIELLQIISVDDRLCRTWQRGKQVGEVVDLSERLTNGYQPTLQCLLRCQMGEEAGQARCDVVTFKQRASTEQFLVSLGQPAPSLGSNVVRR